RHADGTTHSWPAAAASQAGPHSGGHRDGPARGDLARGAYDRCPVRPHLDPWAADTEVEALDLPAYRADRRDDDPEVPVDHRMARLAAARLVRDRGNPGGHSQRRRGLAGAAVRWHPVPGPPAGDGGAAAVHRDRGAFPSLLPRRGAAPRA